MPDRSPAPASPPPDHPVRRGLARWISIIVHPFVVVALLVSTGTARSGPAGTVLSQLGLVLAFILLPIAWLTYRRVRSGAWTNADASRPSERPALFGTGIGGLAALSGYLALTQPASPMLRGAIVTIVFLSAATLTTPWIKVSLHVGVATLAATTLSLLGSPVGWILAALLPALAWSRLAMQRHTPREVALGFVFGLIAGAAMVYP